MEATERFAALASLPDADVPLDRAALLIAAHADPDLPVEGIALILGVDVLMDMARTATNLIGNCLASAVMARWEGEFGLAPAAEQHSPPPGG